MVVVSLLTAPPPQEKIVGLTYSSVHKTAGEEIGKSWDTGNKVLAGAILVLVLGMYTYFSFWLS